MGEFVSVRSSGRLATIRLDRPPVNALSIALQDELRHAAEQVGADFRGGRFGVPEILLGVIPGLGGTQRLPTLIGARPRQGPRLHRTARER